MAGPGASLHIVHAGLIREAEKLELHLRRLAHAADRLGNLPLENVKNYSAKGAMEVEKTAASLGRSQTDGRLPLLEAPGSQTNGTCGIELANEIGHIVNVQRNFDADAKSVSVIETMYDDLLNLRV